MNKKRLLVIGTSTLLSLGLLTSCDYSDFSLFGFFYKMYVDGQTKKTDGGANSSSSENSSQDDSEVFIPQTYLVTSSKSAENGKIDRYELLCILSESKVALNVYEKFTPTTGDSYTNTSFASLTGYTRNENVITLDFGPMAYTDRTDTANVTYYRGDDETTSKEAFNKAFNTETPSFSLNENGTFALGTQSSGNLAKGLSNATTYWYSEFSSRPSYYMLTLLDDSSYYLNTFCMDSKNDKMPVSAFVTSGTYKSYNEYSTDEYDAVRINRGRGHMFANNNGSNMEFDINNDDNFNQWLGMSIGNVRAYKVSKVGFKGLLGQVNPYGFEAFEKDFISDDDDPKDVDPTEGAMLVLDGEKNASIKLAFFNDGTYHFVWKENKIDEKGNWTYDAESDVLTLSATKSDETIRQNVSVSEEDGSYSISYISAISEQLTQNFVISNADFTNCFKVTTVASFKGDKNAEIVLALYSDGSYHFTWDKYSVDDKGDWSYDSNKDELTLKVGDVETCKSVYDNGNYVLNVILGNKGGLTQTYTINKEVWGKTFVHATKTLKGEKMGENCTLTFNSNGTFNFFFQVSYNGNTSTVKEDGKFERKDDGLITLSVGEQTVATTSKEDDGRYKFAYVYSKSSQCNQDFIMDEHTYKETFSIEDITIKGEKAPEKVNLKLNRDHTYSFNYNFTGSWQSEVGGWKYDAENDEIILTYSSEHTNVFSKQEDGSYKMNYIAGISSQLTQEFVLSAVDASFLGTTLLSVEKNNASGTQFGFVFYSNHSYSFHFYNYGVSEYGSWSYDSSSAKFTFACLNTINEASKAEDGSYTFNYISNRSSQMNQEFTITSADIAKVIA